MTKNIRKHKVNSVEEIMVGLKKESNVLFANFVLTSEKINDDVLVKNFWNFLVEYGKHDKMNLHSFTYQNIDERLRDKNENLFSDALWASVVSYNMLNVFLNSNKPDDVKAFLGAVSATFGVGLVADAVNNIYHLPKLQQVDAILESLRIKEPELYDIELLFNGYTRDMIDTSEYDGKARYQKLHDEYASKDLLRTQLQKDLESDGEKTL